nr:uncharacterized protein LOC123745741 [Procambarus clarkii]
MISVATVGSLGLALHFVRRLIVFLSLRFIQAIFVQGVYVTSWTLVAELFPPRWRCRALVAGGMARPLGVALGALVALLVQHWRAVQLAISLPLLISLLYCWMIPESLRWLLTRGKTRRARLVAGQLARHNLLTLPPTAHAQMDHLAAHVYLDAPWGSLLTLFRTPRLRKHTLIVVFIWLAVSLADSGFRSELAGQDGPGQLMILLGGPGQLGSLLGAGVEAGAVVLAAVLTTQFYRRAFLIFTLILAAALSLAVICVLQLVKESWMDVLALATALRFVGVLIVGGARVGVGVVSVEVAPTTARASAVGLCAAHAALGEILTPLLSIVAELTYPSVPWLTSTAGCLVAALLTLLLPETSGTSLPDIVDEAEVVGLCYEGDILKTCDDGYGKSPYWVKVGGVIVSRSVSEAGLNDDDDRFASLDRNPDSQLVPHVSERATKALKKLDQGAGPSQRMVLPHVQTRRRELSSLFTRSSGSLVSSCSHSSVVSLVDVSKVNGNNSDTTDSNDSENRDGGRKLSPGGEALQTGQTPEKEATKVEEQRKAKLSPGLNLDSGKTIVQTKETKDNHGEYSEYSKNSVQEYPAVHEGISKMKTHSPGPVESDVSISVCSLQFKHIRRPVSPTDRRRRGSGLCYSSSSVYAAEGQRTVIQEYTSRNSFKGDTSRSRYATLQKVPELEKVNARRTTTPSSVLKECIRIARNRERLSGLNQLQEEDVGENTSYSQDTNTNSSQTSVNSTVTSEVTDQSLLRNSPVSNSPSISPNLFSLSSTLEYEAAGGRSEAADHTLRYDTLRTTSDLYHSRQSSFRCGLSSWHALSVATAAIDKHESSQAKIHPGRDLPAHKNVNKFGQQLNTGDTYEDLPGNKGPTAKASPTHPRAPETPALCVSSPDTSAQGTTSTSADDKRDMEDIDHYNPQRPSEDCTSLRKTIIMTDLDETDL